ncbi:ATP-binding protein [Streptomyces sp. NPDC058642]|uniref:ATP-binding protein n=1 Tax=Streptomyces sp. NPDC058642 TaxID=3346572 RepID=UPI00365F30EA
MVIPLRKAADEQDTDEHATLRCSAVWAHGAARAADARQALRAFLARALPTASRPTQARLDIDAELVVSELVTNAIRHAPGPSAMTLKFSRDELTISVWDSSPEAPTVNEPDPHRVGGHGLHLVHAISDKVVVAAREAGKQITAHLRLAPHHHLTWTVLSSSLLGGVPR